MIGRLPILLGAAAVGVLSACGALIAQDRTPQGWTARQQAEWYEATQGSRLIPLAWFRALEQPDNEALFLDDAHVTSLRYIPRTTSHGLPLGFAVDDQDDERLSRTRLRWRAGQGSREPWVGLNCSACHTGEITYAGRSVRVDGGPALADFQTFIERLNLSLGRTLSEPAKWDRFSARVLGADAAANRPALREAMTRLAEWQGAQLRLNATPLRYDYGRLDAFGHIFNKVALLADPANATPNPADAPVSYPFIWNIHQIEHVQYNAIVANSPRRSAFSGGTFDVGALGRNTGEVIGVFADVVTRPDPNLGGYESSVDVMSLVGLEQRLMQLRPPRWPEHFPAIDAALAERGRELFGQQCASCHLPLNDQTTRVPTRMSLFNSASPPGTDPWMACNAYTYQSSAGVMRGLPADYVSVTGPRLGSTANLSDMLRTTVAGVLVGAKEDVIRAAFETFLFGDRRPRVVPPPAAEAAPVSPEEARRQRLERCMREPSEILGYKARPLNGVWATGPFLHNGSVPNLYQLLLPPAQRVASFSVGTREFDPRHVGPSTDPAAPGNTGRFSTTDAQGRPLAGNSNGGHDYGNARLSEADRWALIEYMKRL